MFFLREPAGGHFVPSSARPTHLQKYSLNIYLWLSRWFDNNCPCRIHGNFHHRCCCYWYFQYHFYSSVSWQSSLSPTSLSFTNYDEEHRYAAKRLSLNYPEHVSPQKKFSEDTTTPKPTVCPHVFTIIIAICTEPRESSAECLAPYVFAP